MRTFESQMFQELTVNNNLNVTEVDLSPRFNATLAGVHALVDLSYPSDLEVVVSQCPKTYWREQEGIYFSARCVESIEQKYDKVDAAVSISTLFCTCYRNDL